MVTKFAEHLLADTHANRPAATAVPVGTLFACSDHTKVYQSDGAAWADWHDGSGGGGSGGVTLIEEQVLAADAATVEFRNIPSTFSGLKLVCYVRSANVGDNDRVDVRFGTGGVIDTGANYDYFGTSYTDSSGINELKGQGQSTLAVTRSSVAAANDPANTFSSVIVEIPAYRASGHKITTSYGGKASSDTTAGAVGITQMSGLWRDTGEIDSIDVFAQNGDLVTGSRLALYGFG